MRARLIPSWRMDVKKRTLLVAIATLLCASGCGDSDSDSKSTTDGGGGNAGSAGAGSAAGAGTTSGAIGDPCTSVDACPAGGSGSPVCLSDWPGGYCAVDGCEQHGHDCPNDPGLGGTAKIGGKCVIAPTNKCLALCASNADCREGYSCVPKPDAAGHGTADVCFPDGSGGSGGMGGGTSDAGMSGGGMSDGGGMMDSGGMMDGGGM